MRRRAASSTHRHVFMNHGMWVGRAPSSTSSSSSSSPSACCACRRARTAPTRRSTPRATWTPRPRRDALPRLRHQLRRLRLADVAQRDLLLVDVRPATSSPAARWRRMCVWILVSIAVDTPINGHHLHSMGKLMFAFICFWAYTAFCQFMLIWIADIPDEIAVVPHAHLERLAVRRLLPGRRSTSRCPSSSCCRRSSSSASASSASWRSGCSSPTPSTSTGSCCRRSRRDGPTFDLSDLFAFVGVGGIAIGFFICRMRGRMLVPIGDPFIPLDGVSPVSQPGSGRRSHRDRQDRARRDRVARHLRRRRRLVGLDPAQREQGDRARRRSPAGPARAGAPEVGIVYQWPFNIAQYARRQEGRGDRERASTRYGWVDKSAKIVHIPIEQAMEKYVVAGRGAEVKTRPRSPRCSLAAAALPARALEPLPDSVGVVEKLGERVPEQSRLHRRDRQARCTLGDYLARRQARPLALVYYKCPLLCSLTLNGVVGALRQQTWKLGQEYRVITVSFDPEEKPALARAEAARLPRRARPRCPTSTARTGPSSPATSSNIDALSDASASSYRWDDGQQDVGPHRRHHRAVARRQDHALPLRRAVSAARRQAGALRSGRRQGRHHVRARAAALLRL